MMQCFLANGLHSGFMAAGFAGSDEELEASMILTMTYNVGGNGQGLAMP